MSQMEHSFHPDWDKAAPCLDKGTISRHSAVQGPCRAPKMVSQVPGEDSQNQKKICRPPRISSVWELLPIPSSHLAATYLQSSKSAGIQHAGLQSSRSTPPESRILIHRGSNLAAQGLTGIQRGFQGERNSGPITFQIHQNP